MPARHILSVLDLSAEEISRIVHRAMALAKEPRSSALSGKTVALLFEKPSLRTRASFDVGLHQMGGHGLYMGPDEVGLGRRERVSDVARVLSRYVDCVVARVNSHSSLQELAEAGSVSVVNALSDLEHPCQALADLQTIYQHKGGFRGLKVAYIGDGNNVARSLCLAAASVGASFTIAAPPGYGLDDETLEAARSRAASAGGEVSSVFDPVQGVAGADVVYTDVWTSMGQEGESEARRSAFAGYTVDRELLSMAAEGAIFMHPMPAHYGEEVPEGMLEHPQSVAYDQAGNRLHAQKAALELVIGGS